VGCGCSIFNSAYTHTNALKLNIFLSKLSSVWLGLKFIKSQSVTVGSVGNLLKFGRLRSVRSKIFAVTIGCFGKKEEEEEYPAFRLPFGVGCCPRTVSRSPIFFLHLLLNVALDRRPA